MSTSIPLSLDPQFFSPTFVDRFWKKVNKHGPVPPHRPELGPCWLWTGATNKHGQGSIQRGIGSQSLILAARASWIIHYGVIPEDTPCVLHHCDVPRCIRPTHLWLGTKKQNSMDMVAKGRHRGGAPVGTRRVLTPEQHREMLAFYPGMSIKTIASQFGIGETTVRRYLTNHSLL